MKTPCVYSSPSFVQAEIETRRTQRRVDKTLCTRHFGITSTPTARPLLRNALPHHISEHRNAEPKNSVTIVAAPGLPCPPHLYVAPLPKDAHLNSALYYMYLPSFG